MLTAADKYHRTITEYGRQKLGSMPTPFSDSLIPIDRLPRALKINCRPASIRLSFNQPSLLSRISLPASVSSYSSFLSHEDVTCQDDWFGWHIFVFQEIRSMVYHECFRGVSMSQEDLYFLYLIQFDSWLARPLDFSKVLVSFCVITMIFPL